MNELATEVIRIVTVGVTESLTAIDSLSGGLAGIGLAAGAAGLAVRAVTGGMGLSFGSLSRGLRSVYQDLRGFARTFSGLATVARTLTFGGGLGLAGIITGASRGTEEGFRFGQAMEYLTKVLGDAFAPYVRMATQAITDLANWFRSLSSETRDSVAQWSLLTAAFGATVAIIPMVVRGIASVAGVLSLLTSPTVLGIAAFAGLVAGVALLFDFFSDKSGEAANNINASTETWVDFLFRSVKQAATLFANFWNSATDLAAAASDKIAEFWVKAFTSGGLQKDLLAALKDAKDVGRLPQIDLPAFQKGFDRIAGGLRAAVPDFADIIKGVTGAGDYLQRLRKQAGDTGMHVRMPVGFEGFEQTWQRLQVGLVKDEAAFQDKMLAKVQELIQFGTDIVAAARALRDAIPAVR